MSDIFNRENEVMNTPSDGSYLTWSNAEGRNKALKQYGETVSEFCAKGRSSSDFVNYDNSRKSMRSDYHRGDYEYVRPNEATPWRSKDMINKSIRICEEDGRINDIFSLMADFSCQGISLEHHIPVTHKLYQNWFEMVKGPERSERFCYYLLKQANVPIDRTYGKLSIKDKEKWKRAHNAYTATGAKSVNGIKIEKNRIPMKYKFMNIMTIEPEHGDDNPLYGLDDDVNYYLKITKGIQDVLSSPSSHGLSAPVRRLGITSSQTERIPLDKDKFSVYFYKKDDWKPWADPILRPIFTNIAMLRKLELADASALDGIISSVRLWKLGSLEHEMIPDKAMVLRLRAILAAGIGGGPLDLIWGPDIDFKDSSTDAHKFLGSEKYQPTLDAIYSGLGVPPALRGDSGQGLGNNFISLQTFIERLQYIRNILVEFWTNELKIVQAALGLPSLPQIKFNKMILGDESSEKQLMTALADRGVISNETLQKYIGVNSRVENARISREEKARTKRKMPPKASPFHNPQVYDDLRKIIAQSGTVTPSELGIDLGERKEGEKSKLETMSETQVELSKNKVDSNLPNNTPTGENNGRPKNSKDSSKRKQRKVSPQTTAFINAYAWASNAQHIISDLITPKYLQAKDKNDVRGLTASEKRECEEIKMSILFSLPVFSEVEKETVYSFLESPTELDKDIYNTIQSSIADIRETTGKNASVNDVRDVCAIVYSYQNMSKNQVSSDNEEE